MEVEFKQLEEKIARLIQRLRELETERARLQVEINELEQLQETAARRINGILDRLEEPE